jgi:hypothetical protein
MSLRFEQRNALLKARNLLRDCLDPQKRPKTVKQLRERAYSALRHFPFLDERGEPLWSQDEFEMSAWRNQTQADKAVVL